jgi:hypothetical protein
MKSNFGNLRSTGSQEYLKSTHGLDMLYKHRDEHEISIRMDDAKYRKQISNINNMKKSKVPKR